MQPDDSTHEFCEELITSFGPPCSEEEREGMIEVAVRHFSGEAPIRVPMRYVRGRWLFESELK